jgi:hypothetical protein
MVAAVPRRWNTPVATTVSPSTWPATRSAQFMAVNVDRAC